MCIYNLSSKEASFGPNYYMNFNLWQVESGDLISYGLIPEFVGRFPVLVSLSALTENQLVQVIIYFS